MSIIYCVHLLLLIINAVKQLLFDRAFLSFEVLMHKHQINLNNGKLFFFLSFLKSSFSKLCLRKEKSFHSNKVALTIQFSCFFLFWFCVCVCETVNSFVWMENSNTSYIMFDMSHFYHRMLFVSYIVPLSKHYAHEWIFWAILDLWFTFRLTEKKVPSISTYGRKFFGSVGKYELFFCVHFVCVCVLSFVPVNGCSNEFFFFFCQWLYERLQFSSVLFSFCITW